VEEFLRHAAGVIGGGIATVLAVSVLVFGAMHLIPGSFADLVLPPEATAETRARIAAEYGLDQPIPIQSQRWLFAAARGDLGTSLVSRQAVSAELAHRAPVTVELTVLAALLAAVVGLPLGLLAGLAGTRRWSGGVSSILALLFMSVPSFVLGGVFVYVFSANSFGLKAGGFVPLDEGVGANLATMVLPAITLAIPSSALIARTTRGAVLGVLSEPFIGAAVARGTSPWVIVRRHVIRNASVPVLTVFAVTVAYLLGGAVIVESIYSLPGFGSYVVQALQARDYAVVQAGVLVGTSAFVVSSVVVDLAYGLIDPRVRPR
jgi:peptide/nickel transport system permease protein